MITTTNNITTLDFCSTKQFFQFYTSLGRVRSKLFRTVGYFADLMTFLSPTTNAAKH